MEKHIRGIANRVELTPEEKNAMSEIRLAIQGAGEEIQIILEGKGIQYDKGTAIRAAQKLQSAKDTALMAIVHAKLQ